MRPIVRGTVKTSFAIIRSAKEVEVAKATKEGRSAKKPKEADTDGSEPPSLPDRHTLKAKEFQTLSVSATDRMDDISQVPLRFPQLRGAEKSGEAASYTRWGVFFTIPIIPWSLVFSNEIPRFTFFHTRTTQSSSVASVYDQNPRFKEAVPLSSNLPGLTGSRTLEY
ncbi:hypothetical protein PM082_024029 [Marasmius tenuissimus]|nr:hypothetical protein PM082_024029 [Marasmius tenuissimus]